MGKIEVGGKYTSHNGCKWKCIFMDGDNAWLIVRGGRPSAAYVFKTDGTNISHGGGKYNIKFAPVVEWVECDLNYDHSSFYGSHDCYGDNLIIRFPLIDGTPDWSQAKVTPA